MRILHDKTKQRNNGVRREDVLPGIIATVTDDKKNEIYLDMDLELEPVNSIDEKHDQKKGEIPPRLITAMASQQKKGNAFWGDRSAFSRQFYILTGSLILGLGFGLAVLYLVYSEQSVTDLPAISAERQAAALTEPAPDAHRSLQQANVSENPVPVADNDHEVSVAQNERQEERPEQPLQTQSQQEPAPAERTTLQTGIKEKVSRNAVQAHTETDEQLPGGIAQTRFQESTNYYFYSGYSCEQKGDYAGALTWYKRAFEIDSQGYRLPNKIAYVLMQLSLYDDAENYLRKALTSKKDYIPALINMGIVSAKQGKYPEAEQYFSDVLVRDGTNVNALYNLMLLSKKQHNYKRASELDTKLTALGFTQR